MPLVVLIILRRMRRSFVSVLLLFLFAFRTFAVESPATLALGTSAPEFKLPATDGKTYSLKSFADAKVLVVIFTCNHCPTAQAYEERIKNLVNDYKSNGVVVVAISPNDPKSIRLNELGYTDLSDSLKEMKIRAKAKQFNFPYLYDGDNQRVSRAYGPVATPHAFVFDQSRKLRYVGRIDDNEQQEKVTKPDLRNALDDLLAGREVKVSHTKAFGCSTKWAGKQDAVKEYMAKLAEEPVALEQVSADGLKGLRKKDSGKFRLINFWATWCGGCVAEFPDLVSINRMYRHRDFEFVTVAVHLPDDEAAVKKFLTRQQCSAKNYILDGGDKAQRVEAFDSEWKGALPYTVLISPTGEVVYRQEGEVDPLELKRAIVNGLGRIK